MLMIEVSLKKVTLSSLLRARLFSYFCSTQNQKSQVQHKGAARRSSLQKGPMTVMVLKATEPFEYESPEEGKSTMFHATVVTASQFFQVKVFNTNLKEKFTKQKFITISDYSECKGNLEINKASSVSEAGPDQKFEVPKHIIKRANQTPKIDSLHKQAPGTIVYGLFVLHQVTSQNCFAFAPSSV